MQSENESTCVLDRFRSIVKIKNNEIFATWYGDNGEPTQDYTFTKIWNEAGIVSYFIRCEWGVEKGDLVVLCYNFGLHFFVSFIGCLRAGVVPVLVYPPHPPLAKSLTKLIKVVEDCDPKLILIDRDVNMLKTADLVNPLSRTRNLWPTKPEYKVTSKLAEHYGAKKRVWNKMKGSESHSFDEQGISAEDVAFIQYTSGSTGEPKGVVVTHRALSANLLLIDHGFRRVYSEGGVGFSWLPQYHDLGLVVGIINPFVNGLRQHYMSPLAFIRRPLLWLELMSRKRVNWSLAPDFAFRLVARKFAEARERRGTSPIPKLDLSSITQIMCAAEPIQLDTKQVFLNELSDFGLSPTYFVPAYGLAENVVGVCSLDDLVLLEGNSGEGQRQFVACGLRSTMNPEIVSVKVVDPTTHTELRDGETGEIWINSSSVASGYFNRPEESSSVFGALIANDEQRSLYLRTGDLGFYKNDYLAICGRIKDLIIVNGVNYYPQDLESACQQSSPGVRPGCVAAFASNDTDEGMSVIIVFEIRKSHEKEAETVCQSVQTNVISQIGLEPSRVVAIEERTILKTTSGKIRRKAVRKLLTEGDLKIIYERARQREPPLEQRNDTPLCEPQQHSLETIFADFFGPTFTEDMTWEELGLSSMTAVEFQNEVADKMGEKLPMSFQEEFPKLKDLRMYLEGRIDRVQFPRKPWDPERTNQEDHISFGLAGAFQGLGILLLIFSIVLSFIPPYYYGKLVTGSKTISPRLEKVQWCWLPFAIPCWMVSFTLVLIILKWTVIGRYKEREIPVPSFNYIRWWFIDRLVHSWEVWVGGYIKDTPVLWLVYRLLGASIHHTVAINGFIREFDLVSIAPNSCVSTSISCRVFRPWLHQLQLAFRKIDIGQQCEVEGHVEPGVTVGDFCLIEKLASVAEGGEVPRDMIATGVPASGTPRPRNDQTLPRPIREITLMGTVKIAWLVFEIYLFAWSVICCQYLLHGYDLLPSFTCKELLYWVLIIVMQSVFSTLFGVSLKWILVGKQSPGPVTKKMRCTLNEWIVDYHFGLATFVVSALAECTTLKPIILKLLGVDIDWISHLWLQDVPASKADLLTLKKSFLPNTRIEMEANGRRGCIVIEECSLGYGNVVKGDTNLLNYRSLPFSMITGTVRGDGRAPDVEIRRWPTDVFYMLHFVIFLVTLIPAYELVRLDLGTGDGFLLVQFAAGLLLQTVVWLAWFTLFQRIVLLCGDGIRIYLYPVFVTFTFQFVYTTSLLNLSYGTPIFNLFLRCAGASVEGKLLFFGNDMYDIPLLTFGDLTVVDRSTICGHKGIFNRVHIGPVRVSGVLHPGSLILANTNTGCRKEIGPCQFFVERRHEKPEQQRENETTESKFRFSEESKV